MKKYFNQEGKTRLIFKIKRKYLLFTHSCFLFSPSQEDIPPLLAQLLLWLSKTQDREGRSPQQKGSTYTIS